MRISENSGELYEELANKIEARDDPAARRAFQELLKTGRSRQEIVIQVSRVIEKRSAGNPGVSGTRETSWLRPHRSSGASQDDGLKKPRAWSDTPTTNGTDQDGFGIGIEKVSRGIARTDTDPAQPADVPSQLSPKPQTIAASADPEKPISEHKTADVREPAIEPLEERAPFLRDISPRPVGPSTDHSALSVPERMASKLRLQTNVPAAEVKLTAPAEALAVTDSPRPAQHGSRASSRRVWPILTGISVIAAAAGLFVLSAWFGGDLEELASASAHRTLTWLEGVRGASVSPSAGPAKPMEKTGRPEQSTASRQNNEMPKSPLMAAGDNKSADTQTEPSSEATSTQATAGYSKKTPSPIETPGSQIEETTGSQIPQGANSPTPVFSQQNEPEVAQQPQTAGPQLPSVDTAALVAQGDQFLSKSDVASARQLYQRATEAGDGRGALRMGMTFDPVFLARWRLRGVRGDRAQAIAWYHRASALGNAEAELMQNSMNRGTGSASRSVATGPPSQDPGVAAPHGQRNSHGARRARAPRYANRG